MKRRQLSWSAATEIARLALDGPCSLVSKDLVNINTWWDQSLTVVIVTQPMHYCESVGLYSLSAQCDNGGSPFVIRHCTWRADVDKMAYNSNQLHELSLSSRHAKPTSDIGWIIDSKNQIDRAIGLFRLSEELGGGCASSVVSLHNRHLLHFKLWRRTGFHTLINQWCEGDPGAIELQGAAISLVRAVQDKIFETAEPCNVEERYDQTPAQLVELAEWLSSHK